MLGEERGAREVLYQTLKPSTNLDPGPTHGDVPPIKLTSLSLSIYFFPSRTLQDTVHMRRVVLALRAQSEPTAEGRGGQRKTQRFNLREQIHTKSR